MNNIKSEVTTVNAQKKTLHEQYMQIKKEHMESIVILQIGGFYQTYYYDAVVAAKIWGVKLVSRPMGEKRYGISCGFPVANLDDKVAVLALTGYKVIICKEVIDPDTSIKIRQVSNIANEQRYKIDIQEESKTYYQKYKDYSDEKVRQEYNLGMKVVTVKKATIEEGKATPKEQEPTQIDRKKITPIGNDKKTQLALFLLTELEQVHTAQLTPLKALQLVSDWQVNYCHSSQEQMPWNEV